MISLEFMLAPAESTVVLVRKGSYTTLNLAKDTENLGKERENPERKSWPWKWKFLPNRPRLNVIQKSCSAKNFAVPPNSVPGLRHCAWSRLFPTIWQLLHDILCKLHQQSYRRPPPTRTVNENASRGIISNTTLIQISIIASVMVHSNVSEVSSHMP